MSGWNELDRELDAWRQNGCRAELWWRDDDAERPGDALYRLLRLSKAYDVPLGIAVSPALADPALGRAVGTEFECIVLQHGYAHVNHAPMRQKKSELGDHRPLDVVGSELIDGLDRMQQLFGDHFLPVMVPPWNRAADTVVAELSKLGFTGISEYLLRTHALDHGLVRCNTHVDIINWRNNETFVGIESALELLLTHLRKKRDGLIDPGEPTGLLTHHLRHDEQSWDFIDQLLARTTAHPGVTWLNHRDIFAV